jgi:hypothetical protein
VTLTVDGAPPTADDAATPDHEESPDRRRLAATIVAVTGAAFIAVYALVALLRIRYPSELEWIEGGMVDHVARIRDGHQLYGPPSLTFIPDIYTPLYFYVSAAVSFVTGLGFFPLRVVSVVSSAVLLVLVGRLTMRDTADVRSGVIAAGLFAATYRLSGAWLDVGRVDTLCIALLFGALLVARRTRTPRGAIAAGALMALAFLTKQVALLPSIAVIGFFLVTRRPARTVLAYAGSLVVGIGGSTLLLNALTGGWYSTYVIDIPAKHAIAKREYFGFFTDDLLYPLAIAIVISVVALVAVRRQRSEGFWFHLFAGAAIGAAAYSARLHTGGYDNVLMPMHAEIAVLVGIGAHRLLDGSPRRWLRAAAAVALLLQFAWLAYNPFDQVPRTGDERAGAAMIEALRALPAPTYLPGHPWYLVEAGQTYSAQGAAIEDVRRAHLRGMDKTVAKELWDAVEQQRFASIVVDSGTGYSYLPDNLCRWYRPDHALVPGQVSLPLTGTLTGPDMVWLPRAEPDERDCNGIGHWTIGPNGEGTE